jgi:hypothetical protein
MKALIFSILILVTSSLFASPPPLPHKPGIYGKNYRHITHKKTWREHAREQSIIDFGRARDEALLLDEQKKRQEALDLGAYLRQMPGSTNFWVQQNMNQWNNFRRAQAKIALLR